MSSNNSYSLSKSISQLALVEEINTLMKSNKIIIPFDKDYFSCYSLSAAENIAYLDLANYSEVEEYSSQDQLVTVQTGIKIKTLQNFLLKEQKWFPVGYYNDETSLLDLILSNETGPQELLLGGLSRHILGLDSILGNGQLIHSGGKVVKNVSGYDLTRFFIGSYGYFALPIRAHIRLYSIPSHNLTFLIQSDDWQQLIQTAKQISNSTAPLAYIELLNQRLVKISILEKQFGLEKKFLLAVRIYGYESTMDAIAQSIKNILSNNTICSIIAEPDDQDRILQELSQISWFTNKSPFPRQKRSKILDVSIKISDLIDLLREEKISCFPFVYKVASNRMRFCLDSSAEQNMFLNHLKDFALLNKTVLPVAYGDHSYIRRVSNLGYDTSNGDQLLVIRKQLKAKFDPHGSFNPYVEL